MKVNAVIYCRVSTKDQTLNLSLPTQERECRRYCQKQGWTVDRVFTEEGESAKTVNRPEFQKLLLYCRDNKKKIGFVVVYNLSRFSRHTTDHHQIKALLSGFGVRLRSATEPIDDSSSGKFIESMIAAVAEFDNNQRAERTVAGMKAAAELGRWTFPSPIGYRTVTTNGRSQLENDPERAPLVRQAFELFATGRYEQKEVLAEVTALGLRTRKGKKMPAQSFNTMLRKPIYAGWISLSCWGGIESKGSFTPIVSDETFDRVQKVLAGRRLVKESRVREHEDFPLRHFVRCSKCDRPLTASWSRGRSERYAYYRCPRAVCKVNVGKNVIEGKFIDLLRGLQPKAEYLRLFEEVILDVWRNQRSEIAKSSHVLQARLDGIATRLNQLNDAYLYEQKIDRQVYQKQLSRLREDQVLVEMELNEIRVDEFDVETIVNFALHTIRDASQFWIDARSDQRRRFQRVMFPTGLVFDGQELGTATTCLAFNYLQSISKVGSSLASRTGIEPVLPP